MRYSPAFRIWPLLPPVLFPVTVEPAMSQAVLEFTPAVWFPELSWLFRISFRLPPLELGPLDSVTFDPVTLDPWVPSFVCVVPVVPLPLPCCVVAALPTVSAETSPSSIVEIEFPDWELAASLPTALATLLQLICEPMLVTVVL